MVPSSPRRLWQGISSLASALALSPSVSFLFPSDSFLELPPECTPLCLLHSGIASGGPSSNEGPTVSHSADVVMI